MKKPTLPLCALPVACLAGGLVSAAAAEEGELGADSFLGDVPVFLSVTRLPQNLSETPASVMVIDREMIEAAGAMEVADLLRLVPGFVVAHYHDTDGGRTVVSYYGASDQYARRLQVLVDGMSVYMPATGGVEWPDLPLAIDDIERIEVVRGPNGAAYGSNSFLGVINIITRHPQETETKAWATVGSLGYREAGVRLAGGGDELQYRLTGGYRSSHGYRDIFGEGKEVNDDSITRSLALRADYRASVNDYWTFGAGYANGPREVGMTNDDPASPRRFQQMDTDYEQVRWRRMVDSESEIQVQLYRNQHTTIDRFQTGYWSEIFADLLAQLAAYGYPTDVQLLTGHPDQRFDVDQSLTSERWDLEASHRFRLSSDWRLVWGAGYRLDTVSGESYFDGGDTFSNEATRLFFNGEWQPDAYWVVNIGDLFEDSQLIDQVHSPRLSIARKLSDSHFIRATASRAYRIPSFLEENTDFTYRYDNGDLFYRIYKSVGDLDPERIDSVELAIASDDQVFGYEVKVFRDDIKSSISVPKDTPANLQFSFPLPVDIPMDNWRMLNGSEMTIYGTEVQATLRPQPDLLVAVGMSAAHASGWRLTTINPEVRKDIADSVPETTFSLLISKRFQSGNQLAATYSAVSPVRHFSGDITDGVTTADIHFMHPFVMDGHRGRASLLLRDVMGSYFDYEDETAREYQAFLTLEVSF